MLVLYSIYLLILNCYCIALKFQVLQKYKLENPRSFHYLNQTNCFKLDGVDESKEYLATRSAMDVVGISHEDQVAYFSLNLAMISEFLH